jgi:fructuronate reductase
VLSLKQWQNEEIEFKKRGIKLPRFDVHALKSAGLFQPQWIHFGGGNLYRAFHAAIAQDLADKGELDRGIVVAETFDPFTVDRVYRPYNNDILQVIMHTNGKLDERVLAITAGAYFCNTKRPEDLAKMICYFKSSDLQLSTLTITEKGYAVKDIHGSLLASVVDEIQNGPKHAVSTMGIITALLFARFLAGAAPIAMVSTDNFSRNGFRFRESVLTIAHGWLNHGYVSQSFLDYISDESRVSFPWSMIDRITPNPAQATEKNLVKQGFSDLGIITTKSGSHFSGFSNTEEIHYLVLEDNFPNGRPAFEKTDVILADRETVEKADTMKVTACLNPLHTCLAVFGCLLGYDRIYQEMRNPDLVSLIRHLGYDEDLPVVIDPGVIDPKKFIDELIDVRLPNPNLPDTPQRIATDTSQKVPIRYGYTIQTYIKMGKDVSSLIFIPLTIAGWLRYLIGIDDNGNSFKPSPDPLLETLQGYLAGISIGEIDRAKIHAKVKPILSNLKLFGVNLYDAGLAEKIEEYFLHMLAGPGAIAVTIHKLI